MRLKWIFWLMVFVLVLVFSGAVAFAPSVGRYPTYFAALKILLAPVFFVLEFAGRHHLWPVSEKVHWPIAVAIGFLITLTSMAYAGIVTGAIALVRKK
jgi:hypothetical protein